MFLFTDEIRACPECAEKMLHGSLELGGQPRVLYWKSQHEYTFEEKSILGRKKKVHKQIRHMILSEGIDDIFEESAWYCPKCGRIDVTFRTKKMDVSH